MATAKFLSARGKKGCRGFGRLETLKVFGPHGEQPPCQPTVSKKCAPSSPLRKENAQLGSLPCAEDLLSQTRVEAGEPPALGPMATGVTGTPHSLPQSWRRHKREKIQGAVTCFDRRRAALTYARGVLTPFSLDSLPIIPHSIRRRQPPDLYKCGGRYSCAQCVEEDGGKRVLGLGERIGAARV